MPQVLYRTRTSTPTDRAYSMAAISVAIMADIPADLAPSIICLAVEISLSYRIVLLNSSANRGACTQICRRSYTVRDRETGEELDIENKYIMSPK